MQFTRVIYQALLRCTITIVVILLFCVNILFFQLVDSQQQREINSQAQYLRHALESEHHSVDSAPRLFDSILAWHITDAKGKVLAGSNFAKGWNMSESRFSFSSGELIINHQSLLASYWFQLLVLNTVLLSIIIIGVAVSHKVVFKHWKVLIQLEAWASRFSRNDKFKFYIKTREYHLVNTVRNINNQRIEAQLGGQQVDHFIRSQTFLDKDTGLGNRVYFEHRLESTLRYNDAAFGAVLLIQYGVLDVIRDAEGQDAANDVLKQFADIIKGYLDDTTQSVVSRISTNDFAILLPFVDEKEVERVAISILRMCQKIVLPDYIDPNAICHIGADMFTVDDSTFQILAEADMALRAAQLHGPSGWFMYEGGQLPQSGIKGSVRWRTTIEMALANKGFQLVYQPVVKPDLFIHHQEVLVRMKDEEGNLVGAKVFLPMARRCGLIPEIDKQVLQLISEQILITKRSAVSVNIHIDSWLNRDFCVWLVQYLKKHVDIAHLLIFEISEFELSQHAKKLSGILGAVKRYGAKAMVDQVGLYVVDTGYLNHVHVNYLKLHQSVVSQIHKRTENQTLIRSLQGVINNNQLSIFAMGVESQLEVDTLVRLGISGAQGQYIHAPSNFVLDVSKAIELS